jgi:hypothetical protein
MNTRSAIAVEYLEIGLLILAGLSWPFVVVGSILHSHFPFVRRQLDFPAGKIADAGHLFVVSGTV